MAHDINERFATALSELIGMCVERGMHPMFMAEPIERELCWIRETIETIDADGGGEKC